MNRRYGAIAVVLLLALTVTGLALAAGDEPVRDDDSATTTSQENDFVGLTLDDASALADAEGRPWRVAREDGESFGLTDDLVPGRVTFEVDGGIVSAARVEQPNTDTSDPIASGDTERAELIAAALERLLTVDNSFGGRDVFDDIRVARQNLEPLDLDFVMAALARLGSVQFIDDIDAEIDVLFDQPPAGVAVVGVERVELLDDRAEVELRLWCGSLCGVFLTYEAAPVDGGWEITGITGPIAMS